MDDSVIVKALQDIADNGRRDSDRLIKQEANYEHLTKAMEDLTISAATSAKATALSADKTVELTLAIKEIALNTNHLEKRILREIDGLKKSHDECSEDRRAYSARFEKLELHNSKILGEAELEAKTSSADSALAIKVLMSIGVLLTAINVYVTYLGK